MIDPIPEIRTISVDAITVLNPRARNKRLFEELVTSIAHLGLKKPIMVNQRDGVPGFELVYGQGRLEAFMSLGQREIPALVLANASSEDCYLMSLVENLTRRHHSSLELMREIGALKERGYTTNEIAAKTDFSPEYVYAICYLLEHGEDRLIGAVERGIIPASIAMEIARAKDDEVQRALAEAYEKKTLPGPQIMAIRRIIEERNQTGKGVHAKGSVSARSRRQPITSVTLVRAYRKETERQKLVIKKASIVETRLIFVVQALQRLLNDAHFVTLLRAEGMPNLPQPLASRLGIGGG